MMGGQVASILLTYVIVCGAAYALGGPGLAGLVALALTTLAVMNSLSHAHMRRQTEAEARARHREDGQGHVYYRQRDGKLVHESNPCAGCMENRVHELEHQGYLVEQYIQGRHHSGEL